MKTKGFNAIFYAALLKRIQLLIVFVFPLILSAQPDYNFQNHVLARATQRFSNAVKGICNPSIAITDYYYCNTNYSSIKNLQGNPIMTMTKSNDYESRNPMLMKPTNPIQNENQFNSSMKNPKIQCSKIQCSEIQISENPMTLKTRYPENHRNPIHLLKPRNLYSMSHYPSLTKTKSPTEAIRYFLTFKT